MQTDGDRFGSRVRQIPMSSPDISSMEIAAVNEVLMSSWLSMGPKTGCFEGAFARYVGTKHAVAVSSGTSALHLAVSAAGVGSGDEVITPSFSFIASANCVLYQGGKPVFVDVDPGTATLDAGAVEAAITERTRAILPVHTFGHPADMDAINGIARKYDLCVLEDACEAVGAEYKGRRVGSLGDCAVFSFYPNKQMTTGEGAMIVTNDEEWARHCRSVGNQGRDVSGSWLHHARLGYNYRMDEMSAALGLGQLTRIDELLAKRARVAAWYEERVSALEEISKLTVSPLTSRMSWFVFVVKCHDEMSRRYLMTSLEQRGVPTRPYFTPIHLQPFYQKRFGWRRGDLPVTEELGDTVLALPFSGVMAEGDVEHVCEAIRAALGR